jgi:hypothetical protein
MIMLAMLMMRLLSVIALRVGCFAETIPIVPTIFSGDWHASATRS